MINTKRRNQRMTAFWMAAVLAAASVTGCSSSSEATDAAQAEGQKTGQPEQRAAV
ncbi:MAG: hypothetical protein ACOYBE_06790 [Blautia sp.]